MLPTWRPMRERSATRRQSSRRFRHCRHGGGRRNRFVGARGTIDYNAAPGDGTYAGDAEAVEVTVEEDMPRMFTALFAEGTVDVSGRAVARISEGQQTCVLALDRTPPAP